MEVGSRNAEVGSRNAEVGSRNAEVGSRNATFDKLRRDKVGINGSGKLDPSSSDKAGLCRGKMRKWEYYEVGSGKELKWEVGPVVVR